MPPQVQVAVDSPIATPSRTPGRRVSPSRSLAPVPFVTRSRRGSNPTIPSVGSSSISGRITRAGTKHPLSIATIRTATPEPLSPLRRSAGVLHLDQASFGSPVAKRHYKPAEIGTSDRVAKEPALSPTLHYSANRDYVSVGQFSTPVHNDLSVAAVSAKGKLAELSVPDDEKLFKVRRTISVDNFLSRDSPFSNSAPLPNPSAHPHPLSQSHTVSSLAQDDSPQHRLSINATKKKRPSQIPVSASWSNLSRAGSSNSSGSFETPVNYRLVKPFQPAFMSTGLLSKRNRQSNVSLSSNLAPPDTPCKRPAQPQFSAVKSSLKLSMSMSDFNASTDAEEIFDLGATSQDYEMPPTPTKAASHSNSQLTTQAWAIPLATPVGAQCPIISPTASTLIELKTPSTPAKPSTGYFDPTLTPSSSTDTFLLQKFQDVTSIGSGEFSAVYLVTERHYPHNKFAVKRTKTPLVGQKSLERRLEEVAILKDLSSRTENEDREYIINFIDSWEYQGHLYIITEYCENGNLDVFLAEYGRMSKLDEWRVWKILVEIAFGLRFIHDNGYIHLDLKPANVFITFEGSLKIGDFGMAMKLPATKGIEREGDREYIAPEVLARQEYSKPADIFSFGLVMLEIAANIVLPDNGLPWHKLRSGDLSDAGRLSSSSGDISLMDKMDSVKVPSWAPDFMHDESAALDKLVKWMLNPVPSDRPTIHDILRTSEVQVVEARRKSGAVIFEGEYGPEPETENVQEDANMRDQDEDWRMEL